MHSYVEKYAELKIQTLKKSACLQYGYMQMYTPRVTPITKKSQNGGTLYLPSNFTYLAPPEQFLTGAKVFPGTS